MQKNALGTKLGNFPSLPIPVGGGVLHGTRQSSPAVQSWGRSLPNIEAGGSRFAGLSRISGKQKQVCYPCASEQ